MRKTRCLLLLGGILWAQSLHLPAATVTVFAASSLRDSLREIALTYESRSGDRIRFNFSGSNMLARQIQEGAPADLFFSADEAKLLALEQNDLLVKGTRLNRLSNTLVIITAADSRITLTSAKDLAGPGIQRLALGDPQAVPIGLYAKAYLQKLNLWSSVKHKVVPTDNVRAALAAVEAGNADASMVYKTDAAISRKIRIACEISRDEGPNIIYPLALVKGSPQPEAAQRFWAHLASADAGRIFQKHGFIVLEPGKK